MVGVQVCLRQEVEWSKRHPAKALHPDRNRPQSGLVPDRQIGFPKQDRRSTAALVGGEADRLPGTPALEQIEEISRPAQRYVDCNSAPLVAPKNLDKTRIIEGVRGACLDL